MSNNRDDKFDSQDDSEYHFSDDEVSYEVESETPPQSAPAAPAQGGNIVSRLAGSRRMLISFGVFLAIVFVVYKVFSPSSTTPATDIAPAAPMAAAPAAPQVAQPAAPQQVAAAPAAPAPAAQPVIAVAPPAQPAGQAVMQTMQPQQAQQGPQQNPAVASMPSVIPVQSAVPAGQSPAAAMGAYIEDKAAALNAASQQVMTQMQNQYSQQVNEFAAQSKTMQNQIQSLTARVADMEAQINQLVQVLTRRSHAAASAPPTSMNMAPPVQQMRQPEVKVAYNVQAIIPGRAWLKSENGETLTVAEGDVIRDVGRVTKIDPYDGVVEINTGTKALSLSYGNS